MATQVRPRNPIARHSDPDTSHAAAKHITRSGQRDTQAALLLTAVLRIPGGTSAEYGAVVLDRYACARRLPELEKLSMVRRGPKRICRATGSEAITWIPTAMAYRLDSAGKPPEIVQIPLFKGGESATS